LPGCVCAVFDDTPQPVFIFKDVTRLDFNRVDFHVNELANKWKEQTRAAAPLGAAFSGRIPILGKQRVERLHRFGGTLGMSSTPHRTRPENPHPPR
jgi:hypothetical protein